MLLVLAVAGQERSRPVVNGVIPEIAVQPFQAPETSSLRKSRTGDRRPASFEIEPVAEGDF